MCLIVGKPRGVVLPLDEHLKNGFKSNKDGIGISYWKDGDNKVTIKKDFLNVEHLLIWMKQYIKKEDTLIVHFRHATSGLVDEGNRHPFPVTTDKDLIRKVNLECKQSVAHNGIFRTFSVDKSDFSDTQNFIMKILASKGVKNNISQDGIQFLLAEYLGYSNKLTFLDENGILTCFGHFETEKCEGGVHYFSNLGYKTKAYETTYNSCGFNRGYGYLNEFNEEELKKYYQPLLENKSEKKVKEVLEDKNGNTKDEPSKKSYDYYREVGRKGDGLFEGYCEGCDDYVNVRKVASEEGKFYFLCKKCRRKERQGKIILKTIVCTDCEIAFLQHKMIKTYDQFPLCVDCALLYRE